MAYDHTAKMKERRDKWKAAGLCATCGKDKERDEVQRCNKCARQSRDWRCRREYGITLEQMEEMIDEQGYRCALCKCELKTSGRNTHVDHDHKTGEVRGILCLDCNIKLGQYELIKELNLIERFEEYLDA